MIDLRELFPFSGTWDRPVVHRVLELLYGDLALAQLGSAICELFLEKFHQFPNREERQSSCRNPVVYSMQRLRDTEEYSP